MRYQECCELLLSMAVIITDNRVVVFGIRCIVFCCPVIIVKSSYRSTQ